MIFATVGTQLPFDRLVRALDDWAADNPRVRAFVQIGRGNYEPSHMQWVRDMAPAEFRERVSACETVVAHAGMGTIITALELGKRVVVMPRRASLGEHRNEHQLATASRLEHLQGLDVVQEPAELAQALAWRPDSTVQAEPGGPDPWLICSIREFAGLVAA